MNLFSIIKSFISIFLIGVFALGITPKQVLHDVLTHHQHIPLEDNAGTWVGKDRYNCDDENFVASSPFVPHYHRDITPVLSEFHVEQHIYFTSYSFSHPFFFELRGPPSVG